MTVAVELSRTADAPDLVRALAAAGLEADLRADGCGLTVRADDVVSVEHAVEAWTVSRGLPFVPYLVGENRVVLAPPGS